MPLEYQEGPFTKIEYAMVSKFKSHCILKDVKSGLAKLFIYVNDDTIYKFGRTEYSRDSLKVFLMSQLQDLKNFHYVEILLREDGTTFSCLFPLNDLEDNTSRITVAKLHGWDGNVIAHNATKSIFQESSSTECTIL